MLEDELAYVLSHDRDLKQLIIAENRDSFGFLRKLKSEGCAHRTAPLDRVPMLLKSGHGSDFRRLAKPLMLFPFFRKMHEDMKLRGGQKVTVVVNLLRLGLHADLDLLKSEVYRNIREMASFSDGILVFYGTCGHTLGKLEEDFADLGCPLYFLKDSSGENLEDCISVAFGGNDAYAEAMLACRGTGAIYLTPMWASSWKLMENKGKKAVDFDSKYLKDPKYSLAVKLDTGLDYDPDFHNNVREFARCFNMNIRNMKGSVELAKRSYENAREAVIRACNGKGY
ncbi:DUF1638 domain-containing protein [Methanosarcina sp. KYL-1]|uniref:DUF1638 domain-containing protein n=1 Tax=Methanosarcina sp. KYL-1 TaxID=2602068 RepID=UPI0026EDE82D|nr:DUF1638 domain-containing protein [Methanosarcina sp. KYL-1]